MSDDVERTLLQLPQVHVFRIPARKSAEGHRASDWPKDPTWTGKLKIVAKGRVAAIILLDDKNQVFAICQVTDDGAVEKVLDSGRYFVLRITNAQGRHAFIGIAFNERNDSFDFNVALAEFKSELEREDQAAKLADAPIAPMKDLSLKEGEKVKIKFNPKKKNDDPDAPQPPPTTTNTASKGLAPPPNKGSGGGLLPPPKGGVGIAPPSSSATVGKSTSTTNNSSGGFDYWGADPFATPSSNNVKNSSGFSNDPFGSNDPFASNDVFSNTVFNAPTNKTATPSTTDPFGFNSNSSSTNNTTKQSLAPPPAKPVKPNQQQQHQEANLLDF